MGLKKSTLFTWAGLLMLLLNFGAWILIKGETSVGDGGRYMYYIQLLLWLVALNIPAIVVLIVGAILERKEAKKNHENR